MNDESDNDNQDDDDLFRQAMRGVAPLKPDNRIRRKPAPKKPPSRRDDHGEPDLSGFTDNTFEQTCPERLYFERPGGAQKSVLKKLRAGELPIDSTLDLHGLTVDQAREQLIDFIEECRQFDYRHVIIIHGKGFRSQSKPVIKPMVNRWLRQSDQVLAFCSAQPKDGGTGAVYVLLRRSSD